MRCSFAFAAPAPVVVRRFSLAFSLAAGLLLAGPAVAGGTGSDATASGTAATTIRGQVLNAEGKPLVGATVFWKGSPYGVSTDAEGRYQLPLAAGRTVVLFGYAGYIDDEVTVRGAGVQNVTLVPIDPVPAPQRTVLERRIHRIFN